MAMILRHLNKVPVPTVIPNIPGAATNAEHAIDLTISQEVQRVVPLESIWSARLSAGKIVIKPALCHIPRLV